MNPSVPVNTAATLLNRLAREKHARLAWEQRDAAAIVRHHGTFEACQHPDCAALRSAMDAPSKGKL